MSVLRLSLRRVLPIMLICMMASALTPRGYMPSVGAEGFRMVLCASVVDAASMASLADDPAAAALLTALKEAQDQHGSDGDEAPIACPFAGMALADLPTLASIAAPMAVPVPATSLSPGKIIRARHHAAQPPATGPPQLI
jgi:hypothetical protein